MSMKGTLNLLPFIVQQLPSNCQDILEIGCGDGALAAELSCKANKVIAFDLAKDSIKVARERFAYLHNLDFRVGNAENLDGLVGDLKFDCIVSTFALHHVNVPLVLRLMRKHLTKTGRIIIIDLYAERKNSFAGYLIDQLFLSIMRQYRPLIQTVKDIKVTNVLRFLFWRIAFAASLEGRRHIKQDLLKNSPFSYDQWYNLIQNEIPHGMRRVLIGSVFVYLWDSHSRLDYQAYKR